MRRTAAGARTAAGRAYDVYDRLSILIKSVLPKGLYRAGLTRVNRHDRQPGIFYFHPWEIDPDQPRIPNVGWKSRLRHYANLSRMADDVEELLREFAWDRMDRVFAAVLADADAVKA